MSEALQLMGGSEESKITHDILIFQTSQRLPLKLPEALQKSGHSTRILNEQVEIFALLSELSNPIILTDVGANEELSLKVIKSLIQEKRLWPYPLVVIGQDVDAYESAIDKYFEQSITVCTPCSNEEIVAALGYLEKSYTPPVVEEALEPTEEQSPSAPVGLGSTPDIVFHELGQLQLGPEDLDAGEIRQVISLDSLKEKGLLPDDPQVHQAATEVYTELKPWGKDHLGRAALISNRFCEVLDLNLDPQTFEAAKSASLLYPWAFTERSNSLLRKNYLQEPTPYRAELAENILKSADKVGVELDNQIISQVVTGMASLIADKDIVVDTEIFLAISVVTAAELIDRVCFVNGYWSPRGAHYLMRNAKFRKFIAIHPAVLSCMVKFLNEAVNTLPSPFMIQKHHRDDLALQNLAKENTLYQPQANEEKVPVTALKPGMKLSKPIVAYDGKEVLEGDLILDEDLIWRIWQLQAIRPLNSPLVVRTDNKD